MKFVRKFPDVATRNAVFAQVDYNILSYIRGTGVKMKTGGVEPAYATPFYVENPLNDTVEVYFNYDYNENEGGNLIIPIEYSRDMSSWTSIGTLTGDNTETDHVQLESNQRVYFRANTPTWTEGRIETDWYTDYGGAYLYADFPIEPEPLLTFGGNIMSLIYGSNFTGRETTFPANTVGNFVSVLHEVSDTYDASNLILPATELTNSCYKYLLRQKSGNTLENAPILAKATTLASNCYLMVSGLHYGSSSEDSIAYIDNPLYDPEIHGIAIRPMVQ